MNTDNTTNDNAAPPTGQAATDSYIVPSEADIEYVCQKLSDFKGFRIQALPYLTAVTITDFFVRIVGLVLDRTPHRNKLRAMTFLTSGARKLGGILSAQLLFLFEYLLQLEVIARLGYARTSVHSRIRDRSTFFIGLDSPPEALDSMLVSCNSAFALSGRPEVRVVRDDLGDLVAYDSAFDTKYSIYDPSVRLEGFVDYNRCIL